MVCKPLESSICFPFWSFTGWKITVITYDLHVWFFNHMLFWDHIVMVTEWSSPTTWGLEWVDLQGSARLITMNRTKWAMASPQPSPGSFTSTASTGGTTESGTESGTGPRPCGYCDVFLSLFCYQCLFQCLLLLLLLSLLLFFFFFFFFFLFFVFLLLLLSLLFWLLFLFLLLAFL